MKKLRSLTLDAEKVIKGKFKPSTKAEQDFYRSLKKVAQASGHIVDTHVDGVEIKNARAMQKALEDYSKKLEPWAIRQSKKLLETVSKSNKRAYQQQSKFIGKVLQTNIAENNINKTAIALMNEQVALIKSIPIESGLRAQEIAREAFLNGTRAQPNEDTIAELEEQMGMTTEVATSRAKLIAITETARANSAFNQARATAVGARGYIWRATMDGATRPAHAAMNGKYVAYDSPPHLEDGTTGHAGTFPRCRCYGEPVFED